MTDLTDEELRQQLIKRAKELGFIVGLDELISAVVIDLKKLRDGEYIGLHDKKRQPIMSLRAFAEHIGREVSSSYLSQIIKGSHALCYAKLHPIANGLGIKYMLTHADKIVVQEDPEPTTEGENHDDSSLPLAAREPESDS